MKSDQPPIGDLFQPPVEELSRYPDVAGYKATDTSKAAAATTDARTLRGLVLAWLLTHGPHTADDTAFGLGRSPLAIRPRFSELRVQGLIVDSTQRRKNKSRKSAIVWRLRTEDDV